MNTAKLKRFAQDARKKLLEQIAAKLEYVLSADTAELREKAGQVSALKDELGKTGKAALAEKVAYTWFNRMVALRFLDVNGYQPLDLRVISPKDGYTSPELLDEAKEGHVPEDLKVNGQRVYDLLDGRVPSANPQNEAYRLLLIAACNHLHTVLPFLFERINDYTELLLPDDLTSELSVVHDVREGMTTEDCQQVEIIGWLYQFYISEKKDEVFASKAKVKKEDIPAATQLFTPRWIVEYMVQNTVGKLWLQNRPNSSLREHMPYFIESASLQSDDYLKISSPQELTLLDQACGSGHILVYGFELLAKIYEEEGYSPSEIPQLILEHNLFGFEIDERAAQLAAMALMMKARGYQRRLFKKDQVPQPHILCFQDLKLDEPQTTAALAGLGIKPSHELLHDLKNMRQATNLGSLIVPYAGQTEIANVLRKVAENLKYADVFAQYDLMQLTTALEQLQLLGLSYTCIVDNPPYMGSGKMNDALSNWVKLYYPKSKSDLMTCFMKRAWSQVFPNGTVGMINLPSWMFISSFEEFRNELINTTQIETLLHLGRGVFGSDFGTVAFTFRNTDKVKENGLYRRLFKKHVQVRSIEHIRKLFLDSSYGTYTANQSRFKKIPGSPIGYWLSDQFIKVVSESDSIQDNFDVVAGISTGANADYIYYWHEVNFKSIWDGEDEDGHSKMFKKYNKGGEARKWYGNQSYIIKYNPQSLSQLKELPGFRHDGERYYFKESVSWSKITSSINTFRYYPKGFCFDQNGLSIFSEKADAINLLGFLNTKVSYELLGMYNPTVNASPGVIKKLPFIIGSDYLKTITESSIAISKLEWDSKESSYDFRHNDLIRIAENMGLDLQEILDSYEQYWKRKYFELRKNEEDLNLHFIEIFGLEEELTPDVPLEAITILQGETSIENGQLVFHAQEVMAQFISYAVGCMFGRYSLDKPGLILANQGETLEDYLRKVGKDEHEVAFLPDADNIIPVLDGDWYGDDITGRFQDFLKATFGAANLAKNLTFVKECLGKDIRKYFVKDFYNDHIQRYKKRPIYWLFSSPQGSFNALVYLHRYTPDTVNTLLNTYLRDYQEKLRTRREHLVRVEVDGTGAEKARAAKEKDALDKVLLELQDYERNVLYPLATERIALDLDNGVLVNYNRFGKALKAVLGLNDAKAQKQVREFDWVETATTA